MRPRTLPAIIKRGTMIMIIMRRRNGTRCLVKMTEVDMPRKHISTATEIVIMRPKQNAQQKKKKRRKQEERMPNDVLLELNKRHVAKVERKRKAWDRETNSKRRTGSSSRDANDTNHLNHPTQHTNKQPGYTSSGKTVRKSYEGNGNSEKGAVDNRA